MTVLIPSEKGYKCRDCDFISEDIFTFLEHCEISFTWGLRLSNRYSINLFDVLEELNSCLQLGESKIALELIQSLTLALTNASEGEQSFHKFVHESMTAEMAMEMVEDIEEMLKRNEENEKRDKTEE